jgi:hypothetical protein
MARYIRVSTLVKERILPSAKQLLASITQVFQNVVNLYRLAVQTMYNIKVLLVPLITAVQSIKVALISVKARVLPLGQLLLTIVHPTKQAAPTAPSPKRGRPVGVTKSARSRLKENKTVPTPTALQSTQDGLKSAGLAKPLRQPAKQPLKAKA